MRRMNRVLPFIVALLAPPVFADGVMLPDAERVVLENGTTLILVENHEVPLIGLQAIFRGGAAADPAGKYGLASLFAELLEKGAGDRDAAEFADAVARVGGELSATADVETLAISAEFMKDDAELMVELLADMLQRPRLDAAEFRKLRDRSINLIKAAKGSDPNQLMPSYANAFLFGDHPYGNPVGGSEDSLARLTHSDVRAYHGDALGGDRLIIAASGDFEVAAMRDELAAAFAQWRPATGALRDVPAPSAAEGRRVYLIDKPGATQSYFYLGNVGVSRNFADRASLDLGNTVFGGRFTSMLVTELRTKSGLSYSASSRLTRHSQPGSVFIRSFTETGTTLEAIDVALATLGRFRDSGLDAAMMQSARNYVMGQFPTQLETARQLAGTFALLEASGLGASYINDYGAALASATPESVATVIDSVYPSAEELVFVILGDAEIIRDQVVKYGPVTEISITEPRFHP